MTSWKPSEEAFLIHTINTLAPSFSQGRHIYSQKEWEPILQAMISEQPRHLLGGALFAREPWPPRHFTFRVVQEKWVRVLRARQEEVMVNLPWVEIPEQVVREIEEELARLRPIWEAEGRERRERSWGHIG